jgi:hypothetical protein
VWVKGKGGSNLWTFMPGTGRAGLRAHCQDGPGGYMAEIVERASNINGYPSNRDSRVHQHCSPGELFRKFCIITVRR